MCFAATLELLQRIKMRVFAMSPCLFSTHLPSHSVCACVQLVSVAMRPLPANNNNNSQAAAQPQQHQHQQQLEQLRAPASLADWLANVAYT